MYGHCSVLTLFFKQLLWENGNYQVRTEHIIPDKGLGKTAPCKWKQTQKPQPLPLLKHKTKTHSTECIWPLFYALIAFLTKSRAVIGLLTGHNTLRRHLYLLGLQDSPMCRKCGVMEETLPHILCECVALASLRHAYLGSFFLEPTDIQRGPSGASVMLRGSLDWTGGTKGPVYKA